MHTKCKSLIILVLGRGNGILLNHIPTLRFINCSEDEFELYLVLVYHLAFVVKK